ncbi:unnamed protein product [Nezara viridula]|uniref:Uncharacterized protein n=1 Tax=Nezara viridula TaxID=85310 RepID=A0A9P0HTJ5_NEZVI|nr:unnamed protein product [Nezara viridula]
MRPFVNDPIWNFTNEGAARDGRKNRANIIASGIAVTPLAFKELGLRISTRCLIAFRITNSLLLAAFSDRPAINYKLQERKVLQKVEIRCNRYRARVVSNPVARWHAPNILSWEGQFVSGEIASGRGPHYGSDLRNFTSRPAHLIAAAKTGVGDSLKNLPHTLFISLSVTATGGGVRTPQLHHSGLVSFRMDLVGLR